MIFYQNKMVRQMSILLYPLNYLDRFKYFHYHEFDPHQFHLILPLTPH
mgnify:CR=1 FL=1